MQRQAHSSLERLWATAATTALLSVVWVHALVAIAGRLTADRLADLPASGWRLTIVALVLGLFAGATRRMSLGLSASALASGVLLATGTLSIPVALALMVLGPGLALVGRAFEPRLPEGLDGLTRRRPAVALGAALLILLALVQFGRLSTYMANPDSDWFLTSRNPLWANHECLSAYLYGAELNQRGESNAYDAVHYPGLNPAAQPTTDMAGMVVEDPYQYPPQFLLLPTAARALTHDFTTVRVVWFAVQASLLLGVSWALVFWIGGREGRRAALLIPLAITAFPALHALQYGQFHLAAVALSLAALLAVEREKPLLGGSMLAIAITSKLFPGLLLIPLALQRRWRALAWTAAFGLGFAVLGWFVLGSAPYTAFFDYQLARLSNGQAFAFGEAWPEIREVLIADNQGAYGLVLKLQELGNLSAGPRLASRVGMVFGLLVALLTVRFALRENGMPRHLRVAGWLAILGLGALASPGAFGDYVPLTATWLLIFVVSAFERGWRWSIPLAACWLFQYSLLGTAPIGSWMDTRVLIPLSAVAALSLIGLYAAVVSGVVASQPLGEQHPRPSDGATGAMLPTKAYVHE